MQVPTSNITEAVRKFRDSGIAISETILGDGIEQKLFPFAVCIKTDKGRRFLIYETQLMEYLKERSADDIEE